MIGQFNDLCNGHLSCSSFNKIFDIVHKDTYIVLGFLDWSKVNWNSDQLVLDVCGVFPNWIEDGGVSVWCRFDVGGFVHNDGRQVRDRVGVGSGGEEVAQDQGQEQGLERGEPHGLGRRDPEVALVILLEA